MPQHLLAVWPQIQRSLHAAGRVVLLLDYDGTLTPIVDRPDLASMPSETKEALVELRALTSPEPGLVIGIISARSLEDVSARVGIDGLLYAGNHGLEIRGPNLEFVHAEALKIKGSVDQVYLRLKEELAVHRGAIAEHKGLSLTVHYRLVDDEGIAAVKDTVDKTVRPELENGDLVVSPGKMALEIRPNIAWDKGTAISAIVAALGKEPPDSNPSVGVRLVMYFGDDLPDEAGFTAAQDTGGMGIFVGAAEQATSAHYRLDSPQQVGEILQLMRQVFRQSN